MLIRKLLSLLILYPFYMTTAVLARGKSALSFGL